MFIHFPQGARAAKQTDYAFKHGQSSVGMWRGDKSKQSVEVNALLTRNEVCVLIRELPFSLADAHAVPVTKTSRSISSASVYLPFLISTSPNSLMPDRVFRLSLPNAAVDNFTAS